MTIDPIDELLYNLVHCQLNVTLNKKVCPLHYKKDSATYSIWMLFDPEKFLKELQQMVLNLNAVKPLELGVQQIYVDQTPIYNNGVFFYNPLYEVVKFSSHEHHLLKEKVSNLKINKKSRTLKIFI